MRGLYIGSTAPFSGKNLFIVALGLQLQRDGFSVGYMKPVGAVPHDEPGIAGDRDASFIQATLGLNQNPSLVTPILVTNKFIKDAFSGKGGDYLETIGSAYKTLSKDTDVMLVGGSGGFLHSGKYCGLEGVAVAKSLDATVVIIDRYRGVFSYDYLLSVKEALGANLAGVVLNDVPDQAMDEARSLVEPYLEKKGISVLGVVPSDPFIGGIQVGDLAERLGAKIISAENKTDTVVENVLIGTMQVENFLIHFQRQTNSAILVGGDRSDIQLVALEDQCPCLILTGNLYPNGLIISRSESLEIPIIVTKDDTYTVAKKIGSILSSHKFHDQIKISRAMSLIKSELDYPLLKKSLGI